MWQLGILGIFVFHSFIAGFFVANFSNFVSTVNFQTSAIYLYLLEPIISQYLVLSL